MAMWAGVQKVSRPMVMCQEMSQRIPTTMLVEPTSMAGTCQGRAAEAAALSTRDEGAEAGAIDSMKDPRGERLALAVLVYLGILEGSPSASLLVPSASTSQKGVRQPYPSSGRDRVDLAPFFFPSSRRGRSGPADR